MQWQWRSAEGRFLHPPFASSPISLPQGVREYQFLLALCTSYAYLPHGMRTCDSKEGAERERERERERGTMVQRWQKSTCLLSRGRPSIDVMSKSLIRPNTITFAPRLSLRLSPSLASTLDSGRIIYIHPSTQLRRTGPWRGLSPALRPRPRCKTVRRPPPPLSPMSPTCHCRACARAGGRRSESSRRQTGPASGAQILQPTRR